MLRALDPIFVESSTSAHTRSDNLSGRMRVWFAILAITFIAAAPGVFCIPAMDRDESRFAQASKQMLETDDYISIKFQNEYRNKKPAGIYWLQAAATAAVSTAEAHKIWSYRIPSWIGVSLASLATFWCGTLLMSRRAAMIGAALTGSTILATTEAHIAKTDGVLLLVTTLALTALASLYTGKGHPRLAALMFWGTLALGVLIKGPVTPLVAGLTIVALYFWLGRKADWLKPLGHWSGPLLCIALVGPWLIAIQIMTHGQFANGALGEDLYNKISGGSEGHSGFAGFHLLNLPIMFFPATLLLVPAISQSMCALWRPGAVRDDTSLQAMRFLLAWSIPTWIFFEILPTKLSHYVLPAYPALGLLCGWAAVTLISQKKTSSALWGGAAVFSLGAVALLFATSPIAANLLTANAAQSFHNVDAAVVREAWASASQFSLVFWLAASACLILTIIELFRHQVAGAIAFAIATSIMIGWHARLEFLPAQVWLQSSANAQTAIDSVCASPTSKTFHCKLDDAGANLQVVGYAEPSLVFELGTNIKLLANADLVLPQKAGTGSSYVLVNLEAKAAAGTIDKIESSVAQSGDCISRSSPYYSDNYSKGDPVMFTAFRIDPGACANSPPLAS